MDTAVASPHGTGNVGLDDYAIRRIDFCVRRLVRAFHLNQHEADDIRQDLALDLLKALERFDPAQCARSTFVSRALNRRFKHIARSLRNGRRHGAKSPLLLGDREPVCNDPAQGEFSEQDLADLRMDLTDILGRLSPRHRRVVEAVVAAGSRTGAARALGVHRSTVLRTLAEIRPHLEAAGYGPGKISATKSRVLQK
jgi:RNA polymerase sigma factor (sigma-70 family)